MINRFLIASQKSYHTALAEMQAGKKRHHWMWYIFPQMQGLGESEIAKFYGIRNRKEAEEFLAHPILGTRLKEITKAVLQHRDKTPLEIFGNPDNLKFHSSITLFNAVSPAADQNVFAEALDLFFAGIQDSLTLTLLQ